jgi:glycine dehydrogenase subunit 1
MSAHPYFAGSAPEERARMLAALGLSDVEELYASIPARLRLGRPLDLPPAIPSEVSLARRLATTLERDAAIPLSRCFRGGGCWPHAVPEVCAEIVGRAEFRTAYWGNQYTDHGKYQAFFEYASLMGELLELDAVTLPTYDWGNAAAVAARMAARITGRARILLAGDVGPERAEIIRGYCAPDLQVDAVGADPRTGCVPPAALARALDDATAAVYVEVPSYLGVLDGGVEELCALAHARGALAIAGVDPISLGVVAAPPTYGADIACGDLQPLGAGMHFGGGLAGFIATPDDERFVAEYPTYLIGLTPTSRAGEHGFGLVAWERTSYVRRENGKDFSGTTTGIWAIAAAAYLALLGPAGMRELGVGIMERARYAAARLAAIPGVRAPALDAPHFKELVVDVGQTGTTVRELDAGLRARGILGGIELADERMLLCVTEVHVREDIDALVDACAELLGA